MLRSILIGIDLAGSSDAAQSLGIRWAQRSGATLVGLGIVDEPGIRAIEPARPVGGKPGVDPVYYMGYDARLSKAHQRCGRTPGSIRRPMRLSRRGALGIEGGRLASRKDSNMRRSSCDVILLARGSRFRFIAGDNESDETLKKVLRDSPRPVVAVPEDHHEEGPVVIAYDGSLQAAGALAAFLATGLGQTGEVHIISVAATDRQAAECAGRARVLSRHKIDSVPHTSSSTDPAQVILDHVRRLKAGLLVMGAYGQPVLREFFLGSVTRKLFEESPVPLFLYH